MPKKMMTGDQVLDEYVSLIPLNVELQEKVLPLMFTHSPKDLAQLREFQTLKRNVQARMGYLKGLLCNSFFEVDTTDPSLLKDLSVNLTKEEQDLADQAREQG